MTTKRKKKSVVAKVQFTFKSKLYKKGDEFKGSRKEVAALIIKNIIQWQL